MAGQRSESWNTVQSVDRAALVLECFTIDHSIRSLSDLVELTGLPKTTVHRLVGALTHLGMLTRSETGRYRLGPRLMELGDIARLGFPLYRNSEELLRMLAADTGMVAFLAIPVGIDALYISRFDAVALTRDRHMPIGARLPLTLGASPVAMLAFSDPEIIEAALARKVEARTKYSVVDPERVRSRLETIRSDGYAISRRDVHQETVGLGAPVFGPGRVILGGISVGGSVAEWRGVEVADLARRVLRASAELSQSLGYVADRLMSRAF